MSDTWDVILVGGGNAAFCAALAAAERDLKILVLERAPEDESGGNSRFTAGAFRIAYDGVADLRRLMPDLTDAEVAISDFGTYTSDQFFDDMFRVTRYRTQGDLCERLVTKSYETALWLRDKGMRFQPIWGRQAYKIDGKFKFWGGLTVESWGGGPGLVEQHVEIAQKRGIEIRYGARALSLIYDGHAVTGVRVKQKRRDLRSACDRGRARLRRFRIQSRMADPLSRPGLGTRQGARHAFQHRRRHAHGDRHRRFDLRQLVGMPRRRLGLQRAGIRRSQRRR